MLYDKPVTTSAKNLPTLLVHGGAWAIPADAAQVHEEGVRNALETGYAILSRGGSALDAVEAAVTVLEDDPTFDAGRGSFLTSDGRVQLDALLMDGGRMKAGGFAELGLGEAFTFAVEDQFRIVDEGHAVGVGELLRAGADEIDVRALFKDEAGGLDGIAEAFDTGHAAGFHAAAVHE